MVAFGSNNMKAIQFFLLRHPSLVIVIIMTITLIVIVPKIVGNGYAPFNN